MTDPFASGITHQVVRASAGAGKTYQLTTRYLQLLRRGDSAQHILATTFTRKAAGEVLARVLGRLAGACASADQREELSRSLGGPGLSSEACIGMLRTLTDGLNRLSVGTIDGFFNRAARAMSLELGLPTDPRLIDEGSPLAKQMRADAIHAVLGEQAAGEGGMNALIEMLRRLHHDTAQRSVTDAIDGIVVQLNEVYRSYPDRSLWAALPIAGLLDAGLLSTALAGMESLEPSLPTTLKGEVNKSFANAFYTLRDDAQSGRWDAVLGNGLVVKIAVEEPTFSRVTITEDWRRAIYPLFVHAKAVRLKALAEQTRATYDLLELFDRHYAALRRNQCVLLFSDLTYLLAEGLPGMGESGLDELCYRLDARVTHLLLDEFQDTSLQQWAVLGPFAEQIAAMGDGSRSLFCVGDTKQAIYGWRGGCAELFDAVESLPGVQRESLSKSWRSSSVVLDAVNRVFSTLSSNEALEGCQDSAQAWQDGYQTHLAVKEHLPGHVVLRTTARDANNAPDDGEEDDDIAPPDAHAHFVARYIQQLSDALPGRSIGVLVRRRASALRLMHELRTLGVRAAEEGGNPIDNVPAVSAVLSAIQLADHPGDLVSRFHVLNTPVGEALGLGKDQASHDVDAVARRLRRQLLDHGYAAVITQWCRALAPSCDTNSLGMLMQLVELAEQFDEQDAGLRPSFFVQAARAAKAEDPSAAAVRVMTIHAAKGLEFDAVVLPDLDGVLSASDARDLVVLDRDSPIDTVRGVYRRAKKDVMALLPQLQQSLDQRAYEKRTEDLCLLYVAMTRARQALHLLVRPLTQSMKKDKNGIKQPTGAPTSKGLSNLSYAAILRQALREDEDGEGFDGGEVLHESGSIDWASAVDTEPKAEYAEAQPPTVRPIRLGKSSPGTGRSWVQTTPSAMHDAGNVSAQDLLGLSASGGRSYGTLMHALFECIGFMGETQPDQQELQCVVNVARDPSIDPAQVFAGFERAIAEPEIRTLLSRHGAEALWRERRFVARIDGRLVRGTFDRVHLWRESDRVTRALLIDFKTDRVEDETVAAVAAGYADQIGLYRQALSAMLGLERSQIQARLCFAGDGRVVEMD